MPRRVAWSNTKALEFEETCPIYPIRRQRSDGGGWYDHVLMALHRSAGGSDRDEYPGVNWFRRGLQRSLGHAEALVLVKLEQSQT